MKSIAAFVFLLMSYFFASAQCVPDTNITHNDPGIYPDSLTGLPHASVGVQYQTVIQTKVLADSTVGIFHAIVDSVVLTNVAGLPNGFSYECTPSGCSFPGGSDACILLTGNPPTLSMIGTYPLEVQTTIYFKIAGTPQTTTDNNDDYAIVIDTTTGISILDKSNFTVGQNVPNPVKDFTVIPITLSHADQVSITVANLIGKNVISRTYNFQRGRSNITLDLHNLQPGIYLYTVSNGATTFARRMIVSND